MTVNNLPALIQSLFGESILKHRTDLLSAHPNFEECMEMSGTVEGRAYLQSYFQILEPVKDWRGGSSAIFLVSYLARLGADRRENRSLSIQASESKPPADTPSTPTRALVTSNQQCTFVDMETENSSTFSFRLGKKNKPIMNNRVDDNGYACISIRKVRTLLCNRLSRTGRCAKEECRFLHLSALNRNNGQEWAKWLTPTDSVNLSPEKTKKGVALTEKGVKEKESKNEKIEKKAAVVLVPGSSEKESIKAKKDGTSERPTFVCPACKKSYMRESNYNKPLTLCKKTTDLVAQKLKWNEGSAAKDSGPSLVKKIDASTPSTTEALAVREKDASSGVKGAISKKSKNHVQNDGDVSDSDSKSSSASNSSNSDSALDDPDAGEEKKDKAVGKESVHQNDEGKQIAIKPNLQGKMEEASEEGVESDSDSSSGSSSGGSTSGSKSEGSDGDGLSNIKSMNGQSPAKLPKKRVSFPDILEEREREESKKTASRSTNVKGNGPVKNDSIEDDIDDDGAEETSEDEENEEEQDVAVQAQAFIKKESKSVPRKGGQIVPSRKRQKFDKSTAVLKLSPKGSKRSNNRPLDPKFFPGAAKSVSNKKKNAEPGSPEPSPKKMKKKHD